MTNIVATGISSKLTDNEKLNIRTNIDLAKGIRDYDGSIETILSKATLDLNFAKNEHKIYGVYGTEITPLTTAITTVRGSTATYNGPLVSASAANNIPRITYDPTTGNNLGLLVEEQRTNLALQSKDFTTTWVQNPDASVNVTSNAATAPDGTTTADKFIEADTTLTNHDLYQNFTFASATTYTFSIFVKAAERSRGHIAFGLQTAFTSERRCEFDLIAKTAVAAGAGTSAGIQEYPNGWFLVWVTATTDAAGVSPYFIRLCNSAGVVSYSGTVGSGFLLSDAQLEVGSAPSSRIPTTTAAVSRLADVVSRPLTITNTNAGAIFIDFDLTSYNKTGNVTIVSLNSSTQVLERGLALTVENNNFQAWIRNATFNNNTGIVVPDSLQPMKALVSFDNVSLKLLVAINGIVSELSMASAVDISTFVTNLYISGGFRVAGSTGEHSKTVKRCTYFPRSFTAVEAQALTA